MATVVRGMAIGMVVWMVVMMGQGVAAQGDEPYPPPATATVPTNPPELRWHLEIPMIWRAS